MATPFTAVHLDVVSSTQDEARERFAGKPVLVSATGQTAGRGRTGAVWETAPRAMAVSLAWRPEWPEGAAPRLTLVAGLAALDVLGAEVGLKWPNDLMVADRKVGGILTEQAGGVVVTGLGVNLFWPHPPSDYAALRDEDPGPSSGAVLAEAWGFACCSASPGVPTSGGARSTWRAASPSVGASRGIPRGFGIAVGIAIEGGLIVATDVGRVVLESGAVHSVRGLRAWRAVTVGREGPGRHRDEASAEEP